MPSPTDADADSDGDDGGLEESLGRLGDVLWLTSVGIALSAIVLVALLATAGTLGRFSSTLGIVVLGLGLVGVLYLLFGTWDWSPGGEARQHATFLVLLVGLQAVVVTAVRTLLGTDAVPGTAFLVLGFGCLGVAGWLAYLGGLDRLTSLPR